MVVAAAAPLAAAPPDAATAAASHVPTIPAVAQGRPFVTVWKLLQGLGTDTFKTPAVLTRPEPGNPYTFPQSASSPGTNATIVATPNADGDTEMEDGTHVETIVGGKEVVTQILLTLV